MIEGSGSIPLTNGSKTGSGRPKKIDPDPEHSLRRTGSNTTVKVDSEVSDSDFTPSFTINNSTLRCTAWCSDKELYNG
jgi:hypothetical protein